MFDPFFHASFHREIFGREAKIFPVLGRRETFVASVQNDIGEFLTTSDFTLMNGNESLEVVGGAEDTALGAGVASVVITYIDTAGDMATSAPILLSGVTPVALPFSAFHIQLMETATLGAANVTGVAINNIVLRTVAGATHERITAGGNKSMSCKFMVPYDHTGFVRNTDIHAIRQYMDSRLRATVFSHDRSLCANRIFRFQDNVFVPADNGASQDVGYLRFPALSLLKVSAIPGATTGSPRCDAGFPIMIVRGASGF